MLYLLLIDASIITFTSTIHTLNIELLIEEFLDLSILPYAFINQFYYIAFYFSFISFLSILQYSVFIIEVLLYIPLVISYLLLNDINFNIRQCDWNDSKSKPLTKVFFMF